MSSIIEKIKMLRELSKSSNINEATAAALAADKLIQKHRIAEEELKVSLPGIIEDSNVLYETSRITAWKNNLAAVIAENYGCTLIIKQSYDSKEASRRTSRYHLVGLKSDIDIVRYMFGWLSLEIERLARLNCKGKGMIASQSYCDGAVAGIKQQFIAAKAQSKKDAESTNQAQALVKLDNRLQESKNHLRSLYSNMRKMNQSSRHFDSSAYDKGVEDGSKIHLGKSLKE